MSVPSSQSERNDAAALATWTACALVASAWLGCAKVSGPGVRAPDGGAIGQPNADAVAADRAGDRADAVSVDVAVDLSISDRFITNADATGGEPAACATQSALAETLPLDLYVMMDSSGSMLDATAMGPTKWKAVQTAMTAFFNDPASADLGVGLQYFPQIQPNVVAVCTMDRECGTFGPCDRIRICSGARTTAVAFCRVNSDCQAGETCTLLGLCDVVGNLCAPPAWSCALGDACTAIEGNCHGRDKCDLPSYAMAAVPIAPLRTSRTALTTSLNMKEPDGLTPTGPALSGAIQTAKAQVAANPGHKVAVVLVTDGLPTECEPQEVADVAAVARAAATGTPAIPTFVIGVFAPEDAATATTNLNLLAQGGGTGNAVVINTNQNVTQALQMALNQIRTTAVACEFKIPPASGGAIDFGKVNVQLTSSGGGATTTIGHVSGPSACDATRGGWYYDVDPGAGRTPSAITACPASCNQFRAATSARVDIVLGCQTVIIL
ncbi:MAG: hypothetical protein ABUS56_05390 [Acidobacteriota bacterium]